MGNITKNENLTVKEFSCFKSIITIIDGHTLILDKNGKCLLSSHPKLVGQKFDTVRKINNFNNNSNYILFPICHENGNVLLAIEKNNHNSKKEFELLKKFTEIFLNQQDKAENQSSNTINVFLSKIIGDNFATDGIDANMSKVKNLVYDLAQKRTAILIEINFVNKRILDDLNEIEKWEKRTKEAINHFFSKNRDVINGYLGNNHFIIYKTITDSYFELFKTNMIKSYNSIFTPLKNMEIEKIVVGFSDLHSKIEGLIESYDEARCALEIGNKISPDEKSHYFGDLDSYYIIYGNNPKKKLKFAEKLIGKLQSRPELANTLKVFFEQNMNLTNTANNLKIHRNTAIYRLNQISSILNKDPTKFLDAVELSIAMTATNVLK